MSSNPLKDASEFFDKMYKEKDKRIAELEAERDRLREALQKIYDTGQRFSELRLIAKQALEGK